jgi:hypothetical protein
MATSVIRNFVAKALFKKKGAIANNKAVNFSANALEQRLINLGIDPNAIRSEQELNQILNLVKQAEDQAFNQRFGDVLSRSNFDRKGEVFDMTGKKIDPSKGIMGGKEINEQTLKEGLMKTDNDFSDLVKTTEKGPKTLKEREAEVLARMNKENKEAAERIRNRKMVEEAIDNASPGFAGDRKYDAQLVADDLADKRFGKEFYDLDQKQQMDLYDEALEGLANQKRDIPDPDDFAQGGRAGFKSGMGKGFLEFIKKFGVKQSGDDLKDFLSKRQFMKDMVGNTEKNRKARQLAEIKEAMKDAKGYQFPSGEELRKDIEKVIQPILNKDRKLNSDGGRAGYKFGLGPLFNFLNKKSPAKAYMDYLESVKKRMKAGKEAEVAGEVIPIAAGGALITNQLKKKLKAMNEEQKKEFKKDMEKKADGGRIGYDNGSKLSDFIDVQASGTKSGKQQIEGAPEGITIDSESFNAIAKADIPISQKIDLLLQYQYGKGRNKIERGDKELFLDEGGFKSRDIGFGFNKDGEGIGGTLMYNMEIGKPEFNFGIKKSFADGGRIGLKTGMTKRAFLKLMGGTGAAIGALKSGIFSGFGKGAGKQVAEEVVKKSISTPPPYFFELAEKIKTMGRVMDGPQERIKIHSMPAKDGKSELMLTEDIGTGEMQIKKISKEGDDMVTEVQTMDYTPGSSQADEATQGIPADSYDEYTEFNSRIIKDEYNDPDIIDGIKVDEIIEEVKDQAPSIKKAGGGIARMLGE